MRRQHGEAPHLEHSLFSCSEPRTSVRANFPGSRGIQQVENRFTKTGSAVALKFPTARLHRGVPGHIAGRSFVRSEI